MIELSEIEQRLVKHVAKERIKYNRKVGALATVYGDRDPLDAEIDYYGAELAFCKMLNIYPDISHKKMGDEDCVTSFGKRVDVKQTCLLDGRLMVKSKGWDNPPDYFVLMIGEFPSYRFAGAMLAEELLQAHRLDVKLQYPAFTAQQSELAIWR